jgi:hypothetical protein
MDAELADVGVEGIVISSLVQPIRPMNPRPRGTTVDLAISGDSQDEGNEATSAHHFPRSRHFRRDLTSPL